MINKFILSSMALLMIFQNAYSQPDNPVITSPVSATGSTYNLRPWIVFYADDWDGHNINDVRVQIANNVGFSPTTADYWASTNATYRDSFYPLSASGGTPIRHRLYPGGTLSAGTWYVRISVRCDDTVNRASPSWSSTLQIQIISPAAGLTSTITDGSTLISVGHFTALRTAIDNVRSFRGSGAFSWDASWATVGAGSLIRIVHMNNLRDALDAPYLSATGSSPSFTAPDPVATTTLIRGIHIRELRAKTTSYP